MKNLKKILAVVLAMVLMAAMSVTMFAANGDMTGEGGKIGEFTDAANATAQGNTVTLYKELVAVNPDSSTVNAPAISYSYAIAAGTAGNVITDSQGVVANTKAGLAGATITETVAWTNDETLTTSATGVASRKAITVDFSGVNWTGAGVYRYAITETAPNYAASSVIEGDATHVRYLDVYVRDTATGYEIYGYVCFSVDGNITSNSEAAAKKTEGFVEVSGDTSTAVSADKYYTYDLEVTKTVVNDRANNDHDFPFSVTFTPATGVNAVNIKLNTSVNSDAALGNGYAGALTSDTPKLQNGGSVKYIGIPYGTAVAINETNDVAGTTYKVVSTGADTNIDQSITGTSAGVVSGNAVVNAQTTTSLATKTVAVTNTFELISPTGVILRIAPFAIILLAGVALFVIVRRRKVED